ncbi:3'-5' exoribonuclease 1 [Rhizophlyctis rosea]|nr:3'-5' exoribonuclease 1 [Rhizophlyctis rosea]
MTTFTEAAKLSSVTDGVADPTLGGAADPTLGGVSDGTSEVDSQTGEVPLPQDGDCPENTPSTHPVVEVLRAQLSALGLETRGKRQELQKRLRRARKRGLKPAHAQLNGTASSEEGGQQDDFSDPWARKDTDGAASWDVDDTLILPKNHTGPQPYDFYCVLDIEATCEEAGDWHYPHEIIEFPVVLINGFTCEVLGEFREYVRPVINPTLSEFCTKLTGITQDLIDNASSFPVVLGNFERWLTAHTRYPFTNILFICDGPWDIRDFIRKQCQTSILDRPPYLQRFIDLRKLYTEHYKRDRANLSGMLHGLGMKFEGREHSGLDDARNVARIVIKMMEDGCVMKENTELKLSKRKVGRKGKIHYTKGSNDNAQWTQGMHIVI